MGCDADGAAVADARCLRRLHLGWPADGEINGPGPKGSTAAEVIRRTWTVELEEGDGSDDRRKGCSYDCGGGGGYDEKATRHLC